MVDTGQFTIKCQGDGRVIALTANVVGDTPFHLHRVSKHVPPLACYNFDTRVRIFDIFGRNSTNKLMNQKMLYYASSNNLCFCITWQNGKLKKLHFSLDLLVHCQNSTRRCLISSVFSTHDSYSRCCMTP